MKNWYTLIRRGALLLALLVTGLVVAQLGISCAPATVEEASVGMSAGTVSSSTLHKTIEIDGLDIFYREAGPKDAPNVLLLHGFPTSSHMFRNLIPALSDKYHIVAPDYPGYGNSSMPALGEFEYTFDRMAQIIEAFTEQLGLESYTIYLMDYGDTPATRDRAADCFRSRRRAGAGSRRCPVDPRDAASRASCRG